MGGGSRFAGLGLGRGLTPCPPDACGGGIVGRASHLAAGAGDAEAAAARLAYLTGLTLLEMSEEALTLAQRLLQAKAIPHDFPEDALHVAVAVVNGIEYLLTWNYKHLANAGMRSKIETTCRELGYEAVIICTPEELMEV